MTIRSRPASPEYRDNFDRVFGKRKDENDRCGAPHKVFVYDCYLPRGHAGPHDNGGDKWFDGD